MELEYLGEDYNESDTDADAFADLLEQGYLQDAFDFAYETGEQSYREYINSYLNYMLRDDKVKTKNDVIEILKHVLRGKFRNNYQIIRSKVLNND